MFLTQLVKNVSCNLLYHLNFVDRFEKKNPINGTIILSYHSIKKGLFRKHVKYLKEIPKTIEITFDDGYKSIFTEVFPVVKEFEIPITIYIASKKIGTLEKRYENNKLRNEYLNWDEILEMYESGLVTFGAHTGNHPHLTEIDDKEAEEEIVSSKDILEDKLGTIDHFAYPFGEYNKNHVKMVEKAGFKTAATTNPGANTTKTNPFLLNRIPIGDTNSVPVLATKISGLWYKLNKIDFNWNGQNE